MKLKISSLGIYTGGPLVAVVNEDDAKALDLRALDRIKIIFKGRVETVVVDLGMAKSVPRGCLGVMNELMGLFKFRRGSVVEIIPARKPLSIDYIKKKLDGYSLTEEEIKQVVWDIVHNKLSQVELTYFVAGTYCNTSSLKETLWLTEAMAHEGETLKIDSPVIMDKHCIGGIPGNRTSPILVPIVAAAGYKIPKTSSRAITSPAGTADTMEVFCNVSMGLSKMRQVIHKTNGCFIWGGSLNLAPADDMIINVEKTLMIDAESQLLASILAKKHSVGSTHVVIDIPVGANTKITDRKKAMALSHKFKHIGKELGMKIKTVITEGDEPIGNGIGPSLEARDVLRVLRQDINRPKDLEEKSIKLAAALFELVGQKNPTQLARKLLVNGDAYKKWQNIVSLQGGNAKIEEEKIPIATYMVDFVAQKRGVIRGINNFLVSKLARVAGAPAEKHAGIDLYKHNGDRVKCGDTIFTIHTTSKQKVNYVKETLKTMGDIVTMEGK